MVNLAKNQNGYIALIAVLIVVAVTLAIGLSLNILNIGETQAGLLKQQSALSFFATDSCLQEAYLRLERDANYSSGSLNIGQGSCNITVVPLINGDREITVEANVNNIIRKIKSQVNISGSNLVIEDWQEDF